VQYVCPHCEGIFEVAEEAAEQEVTCPHCGQLLMVSRSEESVTETVRQEELDSARIQQVSRLRTAAMRTRSYCLIACGTCAVAAVDLIWRAARRMVTDGVGRVPAFYLLAAAFLAWFAWRMWSRAKSIALELRRTLAADPVDSPDFSDLSDGSQVAENLEHLR